ncbi:ribosome maturation factor [Adhaeribacter arboris]|uniref:Ribosome maturation factor RimP n=1 Tax=Adhaeribacter arboris TaxID=2072846 RepID=A0A2T2YM21_9BACT|nr:ribosome maturation factor [Adhaeribacter arboris]PSR56554.1 ribosome maturation factor [Adhaeribacter arboris]
MLPSCLPSDELFVVKVQVSDNPAKPKITVILDGDNGVGIDECALVSRRLNNRIETAFGEEISYVLEVTSPGADQPLTSERQYKRHVGRKLKLVLKDGSEKTGTLEEVLADGIRITEEAKEKSKKVTLVPSQVNFTDIVKTNIVISFK